MSRIRTSFLLALILTTTSAFLKRKLVYKDLNPSHFKIQLQNYPLITNNLVPFKIQDIQVSCSFPKMDPILIKNTAKLNFEHELVENALVEFSKLQHCLEHIQNMWHYRFCYNDHIIQFYLDSDGNEEGNYILGYFDKDNSVKDNTKHDPINGSHISGLDSTGEPVLKQYWNHGTFCEASGAERITSVLV